MITTVLEGGAIVDGSGRPRFCTDVALVGDRIARIGDCAGQEAVSRINCRGKIVAPGFIDTGSRTGAGWLELTGAPSKIAQGVTTEICPYPDPIELFELLSRHATAPNTALLAAGEVLEAVEAGALGASIALRDVRPDRAAERAGASVRGGAARAVVSLRSQGDGIGDAIDEAIALAMRADVALHVSHIGVEGTRNWGGAHALLERIDRARGRGATVTCDLYPYVATSIALESLLPPSIGRAQLGDEAVCAAVALEMQARLGDIWEDLFLSEVSGEEHRAWCGMRFDEIGRRKRLSPARAVLAFVAESGNAARAFFFCMHEDDVATFLSASFCSIGSSAAALPVSEAAYGLPHPRAFGTFPRIVGRFVRGRKTLPLEDAVRRMTGLAAEIFGLHERGSIAEDSYADIAIFDESAFADTATYDHPISLPTGLAYVFVNGEPVLAAGELTTQRPGRVLRGGRST